MIYMFLSPTDDLGENILFPGQKTVQVILLPASTKFTIIDLSDISDAYILIYIGLLPACATIAGTCFRAMDAASKAFSSKEAT